MPAPTVTIPTTGTDPKTATKAAVEAEINEALDVLYEDIQTRATAASVSALTTTVDSKADDADLVALEARLGAGSPFGPARPGDYPLAFGNSKTAVWASQGAAPGTVQTDSDMGLSLQVAGAGVVAARGSVPVLAGRIYQAWWIFKRTVDSSDPLGDAIVTGLQYLTASHAANGAYAPAQSVVAVQGLRMVGPVTFSLDDPEADVTLPAGTKYVKPYIEIFGATPTTRIGWILFEELKEIQPADAQTASLAAAIEAAAASAAADNAAESAAEAQAAELAAEAARDSSFANAKGDTTISAARARVADGETFIVYAAGAEEFVAYRRESSSTQTLLGTYPAVAKVRKLERLLLPSEAMKGLTVTGLWHKDGAKTFFDTTMLTSWISDDPNALSAVLHSSLYAGAALPARPTLTDRGVLFESQNGFTVSSTELLTQTNSFAIVFAFDFDPTFVANYATKAAADADVGSTVMGDIIRVTGGPWTNYSPDVGADPIGSTVDRSNLVRGYYINNNTALVAPDQEELWSFAGAGGAYLQCRLDKLGRLNFDIYSGSGAPFTVRTHYKNVMATEGVQIAALTKDATHMRLWLNGHEIMAVQATGLANITSFANLYLNGGNRVASTVIPVNGWRWYCPAFMVAENWTWEGFRAAHDAIADYASTPRLYCPDMAWGLITSGQSWWQGATSITDTWRPTSGWDGQVDAVNATYALERNQLSNESLAAVRCTRDQDNNGDIGPLVIQTNTFGNISTPDSHKTGVMETFEWGMFKHLIGDDGAFPVDWTIGSAGAGGATLATLAAETSPAPLVQALKSKSSAALTFYEELLQSVVTARDFHRARGQAYTVELCFFQQGHSDMTNANYTADVLAYYDKLNAAVKRITGQSHDVVLLLPQINYSTNGQTLRTNIGTSVDQKILDIMDNRGTRPIYCIGPMYHITNYIHSYLAGYRWIGEMAGKVAKRILHDGVDWQPLRPSAFTRGSGIIDIDFHVPVGSLQFVDTNENNIDGRVNRDGVDTYGFDVWSISSTVTVTIATPGVVTWNNHGLSNGQRIALDTSGALPTGLSLGTTYYVVNATTNTFQLAATAGGAAIATSGSQSGTHTAYAMRQITAVTILDANTIRITAPGVQAGDTVAYAAVRSRFGNLCDQDVEVAYYRDQDWNVALTSGSPTYADGELNDLRNWCCAFQRVLT